MRYLLILLLFSFSSIQAIKEEEPDSECYEQKSFSLDISTSFHGDFKFEICEGENSLYVTKKIRERESENLRKRITTNEKIILSKSEYDEIYKRFQIALKYNTLDDTGAGRDGSYWCLESRHWGVSTYTVACFVTPSNEAEKRGLVGIHDLGIYLWSFSGLDNDKNLRLY